MEKLNLPFVKGEVTLFLEDGSKLCEDQDITDAEMVGGKLLIIATSFESYKRSAQGNVACIFIWLPGWLQILEMMENWN